MAVEVPSPSNAKTKLLSTVALYLEHGAEQCWLIYPTQRKVVLHFPDDTSDEKRQGDELSFHECAFDVSDIFAAR